MSVQKGRYFPDVVHEDDAHAVEYWPSHWILPNPKDCRSEFTTP